MNTSNIAQFLFQLTCKFANSDHCFLRFWSFQIDFQHKTFQFYGSNSRAEKKSSSISDYLSTELPWYFQWNREKLWSFLVGSSISMPLDPLIFLVKFSRLLLLWPTTCITGWGLSFLIWNWYKYSFILICFAGGLLIGNYYTLVIDRPAWCCKKEVLRSDLFWRYRKEIMHKISVSDLL